jgi:hypothetical protein
MGVAGQGITPDHFEEVKTAFDGVHALDSAWNEFEAQCVRRRNAKGALGWFSADSAAAAFDDARTLEGSLNRDFYHAVPGIVTGFGLLVTFVAILMALKDVNIGANGEVVGLKNLIEGLSGKFVSSIAALVAATLYALVERSLVHRLEVNRQKVVIALDRLVPRLSATQILSNIQDDISEQSAAFRSFNSDLSLKLRQSMSESMGPTLQRMVESIEGLNELLRAAEANRHQELSAALRSITERLEQSINDLMKQLSSQFSQSLSGTAMGEFGKVSQSLGATSQLLENMNAQFQSTQQGLESLINHAKTSAADQMALGRTQIEDLTEVLRGLMTEMSQSANRSVSEMAERLSAAASGLTQQVAGLSEQLTTQVTQAGNDSSAAASRVLLQAEGWSQSTAARLESLMDSHQKQVSQIDEARNALESALLQFRSGLGDYSAVSGQLKAVLHESNAMATAVIGAAKALRDAQESSVRAAGITVAHVRALQTAAQHQEEAWKQMQGNLENYAQVFQKVDIDASNLLKTIGEQLRDYTETTRKGTDAIVSAANDSFGTAALRLKDSVETLDDYLQELTEVLGKSGIGSGRPQA